MAKFNPVTIDFSQARQRINDDASIHNQYINDQVNYLKGIGESLDDTWKQYKIYDIKKQYDKMKEYDNLKKWADEKDKQARIDLASGLNQEADRQNRRNSAGYTIDKALEPGQQYSWEEVSKPEYGTDDYSAPLSVQPPKLVEYINPEDIEFGDGIYNLPEKNTEGDYWALANELKQYGDTSLFDTLTAEKAARDTAFQQNLQKVQEERAANTDKFNRELSNKNFTLQQNQFDYQKEKDKLDAAKELAKNQNERNIAYGNAFVDDIVANIMNSGADGTTPENIKRDAIRKLMDDYNLDEKDAATIVANKFTTDKIYEVDKKQKEKASAAAKKGKLDAKKSENKSGALAVLESASARVKATVRTNGKFTYKGIDYTLEDLGLKPEDLNP